MRFEPRRVVYEKSTGKVYVYGYSFVRQGTSFETERREGRTYEFTLRIANYAPLLMAIDTYEGTPQTRDVVQAKEATEAKRDARRREEIKKNARYIEPKADTGIHTDADRRIE